MGGSLEDTRQMLEGKLVEDGREPRNVQVVCTEADEGATVRLEDENVFLWKCYQLEKMSKAGIGERRSLARQRTKGPCPFSMQ